MNLAAALTLARFVLSDWHAWTAVRQLSQVIEVRGRAEREAIDLLLSYAHTGSRNDFASFDAAIARTIALRPLRSLIRQPTPDRRAIAASLLAAGNDPVVAARFVEAHRPLRTLTDVDAALDVWEKSDARIDEMRTLARRMSSGDAGGRPVQASRAQASIILAASELENSRRALERVVTSARDRLRLRTLSGAAICLLLLAFVAPVLAPLMGRRAKRVSGMRPTVVRTASERHPLPGPLGRVLPGREAIPVARAGPRPRGAEARADRGAALRSGSSVADDLVPGVGEGRSDVLRQLPVSIWTTDRELRYTSVSGQPLPGVTPELGRPVHDSFDPRARPIGALRAHQQALAGASGTFEHELDGRIYRCEVSPWKVGGDRIAGTVAVGVDITEYKHGKVRLEQLANVDPLTNLWNRRRFEEELQNALSDCAATRQGGALVWCDLDHFKDINDSLGHRTGDLFLQRVADAFRINVRRGETLARLGGDEFGLLLPKTSVEDATAIAKRLLDSVGRETAAIKARGLRTTASIGIVAFPQHGTTTEELLTRADVAMYQAKRGGRGRVEVFSYDDHLEPLLSRMRIAEQARACLEQGRMELYLEPICNLRTLAVSRYEALLRMPDENGELMRPEAFLDICASFGMMRDIDRWVIRRGCELLRQFRRQGVKIPIEINLSGAAFGDESMLGLIAQQVRGGDINPGSLIFEISEQAAVADLRRAREFIEELRQLGCQFAIDDFGAGFSSFGYLRHLPVRYLKIDGSFIRGLHADLVNQNLVRAIVEMSRSLGVTPVAEFVDDRRTAEWLLAESCQFGQGAYTGLARPVSEVLAERAAAVATRWQSADPNKTAPLEPN